VEQLRALVERSRGEDVPIKVLGQGANVLISDDGFDGVVVRFDSPAFQKVEQQGERFHVGAGVELIPFSRRCSRRGYSGLEGMAGIPATVGGAVRMNAGGKFGEFGDAVREVDVVTPMGERKTLSREEIGFGYRRSAIGENLVVAAELELKEGDPAKTHQKFAECYAEKRRTQPLTEPSAGCIFKNPTGASAGALIDRAGLKGTRCGGAKVSEKHANFIVTDAQAAASDVLRLIDLIRERVSREFQTDLETEIDIWRPRGGMRK